VALIEKEVRQVKATDLRIDTDIIYRKDKPHIPRADGGNPEDPGVVVRFTLPGGRKVALPCDRFHRVQDNLRAIALTMERKRMATLYGVATTEAEYAGYAALPAGTPGFPPASQVLGIHEDASPRLWKAAFRAWVLENHPDRRPGADEHLFDHVKKAVDRKLVVEAP
jgi:hypothetical protein